MRGFRFPAASDAVQQLLFVLAALIALDKVLDAKRLRLLDEVGLSCHESHAPKQLLRLATCFLHLDGLDEFDEKCE